MNATSSAGHPAHRHHDNGQDRAHHDRHAGHDPAMFQRLFWWNLVLAIPVVAFSEMIQEWFGSRIQASWAAWVPPVLGTIVYLWGGRPFLAGGVVEVRKRQRRRSSWPPAPSCCGVWASGPAPAQAT